MKKLTATVALALSFLAVSPRHANAEPTASPAILLSVDESTAQNLESLESTTPGVYCYWDYVWWCNPFTGLCAYQYREICV